MIQKIFNKTNKWLKIILLVFAKITIFAFTLTSIIFISTPDEQIKQMYSNEMMQIILQTKQLFAILIWILIPKSILIAIIDIWKLYEWLYEKQQNKKMKRGK